MTDGGEIVILSPGLSQSFAIADLLSRHRPGMLLLGCTLPGEVARPRAPFGRLVTPSDVGPAIRDGAAIMTGSTATEYVLQSRENVRLGEITFERRNLWFSDKVASLERAGQIGIPTPATWTSLEAVPDRTAPIFYKPVREGTGGPRRRASSPAAVPACARTNGYLFQEVVEGPSVIGFGFLADRGKIVASLVHRELLSYPWDGGSAVVVEACRCPRVQDLATQLISDFGYSGWGLVEFKPCPRRNDFVFMEVNAKFWASLEFTLRTCPLFARLLLCIETRPETMSRMVWTNRLLRNGLRHLPATLGSLHSAALSREAPSWRDCVRLLAPESHPGAA